MILEVSPNAMNLVNPKGELEHEFDIASLGEEMSARILRHYISSPRHMVVYMNSDAKNMGLDLQRRLRRKEFRSK